MRMPGVKLRRLRQPKSNGGRSVVRPQCQHLDQQFHRQQILRRIPRRFDNFRQSVVAFSMAVHIP